MVNLRVLAEQDLSMTLEDNENGFGWEIVLIDLDSNEQAVQGQIDPQTEPGDGGQRSGVALPLSHPQ